MKLLDEHLGRVCVDLRWTITPADDAHSNGKQWVKGRGSIPTPAIKKGAKVTFATFTALEQGRQKSGMAPLQWGKMRKALGQLEESLPRG